MVLVLVALHKGAVSGSQGRCHKLPYTEWLKTSGIGSLRVKEAKGLKSVSAEQGPPEGSRGGSSLVSSSFQGLQLLLGLWLRLPSLCPPTPVFPAASPVVPKRKAGSSLLVRGVTAKQTPPPHPPRPGVAAGWEEVGLDCGGKGALVLRGQPVPWGGGTGWGMSRVS